MRTLGLLVVVVCVCVWSPRVTLAQEQRMGASSVLSELDEGGRVRVLVPPDTVVEGNVATASARSLMLSVNDPGTAGGAVVDRAAAVESIEALWTRSRRTWLGAAIGAGTGAVFGGLAGAVAVGLSESSSDDDAGAIILIGVLGAGAGAVVGGLVGSAFSHWNLRFKQEADGQGWSYGDPPAQRPDPAVPGPAVAGDANPLRNRTGWLIVEGGGSVSTGAGSTQAGALLGAAIVADFGGVRVGPEVLFGGIGSSQGVITYGGVVQVPVGRGRVEPYVIVGAGAQSWNSTGPDYDQLDASLFALNGGLGLRLPVGSRTAAGAELRAHHSVQSYGSPVPWLFTLAATIGLGL
jgi:hypothetical protein